MTRETIRRRRENGMMFSGGTGSLRYSPDRKPFGAMNPHTTDANEKRRAKAQRLAKITRAIRRRSKTP